tara:strand:- start:201 stop:422 length:222 start_codon:yes stop_codon:yes gene_type:complete
MIFEIGNMVEVRTTYGNIIGVLFHIDELSRKCKIFTTTGRIVHSDEVYLLPYPSYKTSGWKVTWGLGHKYHKF